MKTDKQLLDFLENLNDKKEYTGKCILRFSDTGRGWRLHETELEGASTTVRTAISIFINEYNQNQ